MRKVALFLLTTIVTVSTAWAQEKKEPSVKVSGWVNYEAMYDTRQSAISRHGDIILFPLPEKLDANGVDANDNGSLRMLTLFSRIRANFTAPDAFGATVSGLIEGDFAGLGDANSNMFRIRHAFGKMQWERTSLILGQYWHPMFVPEVFPGIATQGGSIPFNVLSRAPQARLTHKLTDKLSFVGALLMQQDFKSNGPAGYSPDYMRASGIPEVQLQLMYTSAETIAGITAGYKTLSPRLINNETVGSYNANAFAKFTFGNTQIKLNAIYGQDMAYMVMIGGYGVSNINAATNEWEYTNATTTSLWMELIHSTDKMELALHSGYSQNLGTDKDIVDLAHFYGRGLVKYDGTTVGIANLLRISPRVSFKSGKMKFTGEITHDIATYGTPDLKLKMSNTKKYSNTRFLFSTYFFF